MAARRQDSAVAHLAVAHRATTRDIGQQRGPANNGQFGSGHRADHSISAWCAFGGNDRSGKYSLATKSRGAAASSVTRGKSAGHGSQKNKADHFYERQQRRIPRNMGLKPVDFVEPRLPIQRPRKTSVAEVASTLDEQDARERFLIAMQSGDSFCSPVQNRNGSHSDRVQHGEMLSTQTVSSATSTTSSTAVDSDEDLLISYEPVQISNPKTEDEEETDDDDDDDNNRDDDDKSDICSFYSVEEYIVG